MSVYTIKDMRVLIPSPKIAAKNPDRVFSVTGSAIFDENGNQLTAKSKVVTKEMVNSEGFSLDYKNGILTIPSKRVGRPDSVGATADEIEAALAAAQIVND